MLEKFGHRIAIIGPSCSGKSTLAQHLGKVFDLPVHHMDALVWQPGWEQIAVPKAEVDQKLASLLLTPRWVVEGVYARLLPAQATAADTVIFIDLSRFTCFLLYLRRTWRSWRGAAHQLGLNEGDRSHFSYAMAKWILWEFPKKQPQIEAALALAKGRVMRVHSLKEINALTA